MEYITKANQIGHFLERLPNTKIIGFDLETSGLDPFINIPTLAQFCLDGETYVFNIVKLGKGFLGYLVQLINDQEKPKVIIGHNIKFDLSFLLYHTGFMLKNVYDTMVAEDVLRKGVALTSFFSLEELARDYLKLELDKSLQTSFIDKIDGEFTDEQIEYAAKDVEILAEIRKLQLKKLEENGLLPTANLEMEVILPYTEMEITGVGIDKELWLSFLDPAKQALEESSKQLIAYFLKKVNTKRYANALELLTALAYPKTKLKVKKFSNMLMALGRETFEEVLNKYLNFGSSDQTVAFLNLCGVDVKTSNEKDLSGHINHEAIKLLFDFRENAKKVSTYGEAYFENIHPVTGKIHTTLSQNESKSGRVASSKPCLTQIPGEIEKLEDGTELPTYRRCIIPDKGWKFIDLDYSGQELRLAANIFDEPKLKEAFNKGIDVHALTATLMYKIPLEQVTKEKRHRAKTLNFGCLYQISEWGLYRNFGFEKEEATEVLKNFWDGYSGMKRSIDDTKVFIRSKWYATTLNGRKRYFTKPDRYTLGTQQYDKVLAAILREGVNHVIQGTAADVTKTAVKYIYYRNPFGANLKLVLSVHDEIICMAKEEIAQEAFDFVKECMLEAEQGFLGDVPAKVDGGIYDYWGH